MTRQWILYDGRAAGGQGTDDALVLCCADSLREARKDKREMFPDAAIYAYDVVRRDGKDMLENETFIE